MVARVWLGSGEGHITTNISEKCIFYSEFLRSVFDGARSERLWSLAENLKAEARARLTATWTYFHGFLIFTDGEYAVKYKLCVYERAQSSKQLSGTRSLSVRASDGPETINYTIL